MVLASIFFNAVISTEAPPATTVSVLRDRRCPKCGTAKKSGKRSCCTRGGAWFKKCGDPGDTNFAHTWFEGVQACKSEFCLIVRLMTKEEYEIVAALSTPYASCDMCTSRWISRHLSDFVAYCVCTCNSDRGYSWCSFG